VVWVVGEQPSDALIPERGRDRGTDDLAAEVGIRRADGRWVDVQRLDIGWPSAGQRDECQQAEQADEGEKHRVPVR
jgi:hypothetical protein